MRSHHRSTTYPLLTCNTPLAVAPQGQHRPADAGLCSRPRGACGRVLASRTHIACVLASPTQLTYVNVMRGLQTVCLCHPGGISDYGAVHRPRV